MKTKTIWTWGYRPFIVGGNVNYVLACKVECTGPHELGSGYKGYAAAAPNGTVFVAEAKTGAIVGSGPNESAALKVVCRDIADGDKKVMQKQVADAAVHASKAELHDAAFFWGALKCAAK